MPQCIKEISILGKDSQAMASNKLFSHSEPLGAIIREIFKAFF